VHVICDVIFNEGDKEIDVDLLDIKKIIEDQIECSYSREVEDPKEPKVEPNNMMTKVGDAKAAEYERF